MVAFMVATAIVLPVWLGGPPYYHRKSNGSISLGRAQGRKVHSLDDAARWTILFD